LDLSHAGGGQGGGEECHRRIRWAASLLSDVAWRAHPDFRAERGLELALHGNWVAITAPERAMLAAASNANSGSSRLPGRAT
jgi:exopolyphosphatase/guanosine-5'-triphosphate,3'-diphosphate pyrophosphatase